VLFRHSRGEVRGIATRLERDPLVRLKVAQDFLVIGARAVLLKCGFRLLVMVLLCWCTLGFRACSFQFPFCFFDFYPQQSRLSLVSIPNFYMCSVKRFRAFSASIQICSDE